MKPALSIQNLPDLRPAVPPAPFRGEACFAAPPKPQSPARQPTPAEVKTAEVAADAAAILRAVGGLATEVVKSWPQTAHRINKGGGLYDLVSNTTNFVTGTPGALLRLAHLAVHAGAHLHEAQQAGWRPRLFYRGRRRATN